MRTDVIQFVAVAHVHIVIFLSPALADGIEVHPKVVQQCETRMLLHCVVVLSWLVRQLAVCTEPSGEHEGNRGVVRA